MQITLGPLLLYVVQFMFKTSKTTSISEDTVKIYTLYWDLQLFAGYSGGLLLPMSIASRAEGREAPGEIICTT